jgi:hypothetical protein
MGTGLVAICGAIVTVSAVLPPVTVSRRLKRDERKRRGEDVSDGPRLKDVLSKTSSSPISAYSLSLLGCLNERG